MNLEGCQIFDISPLVSAQTAVFPGDTRFQLSFICDMQRGDSYSLSSLTSTVHIGAHADAPSHYSRGGVSIEQRKLQLYLGPAQVIEVQNAPSGRIEVSDLGAETIQAPRILFKTNSFPNPNQWNGDFLALAPSLIDYLAAKNVKLVGLDTPSVDPASDKDLLCHQRIAKADMAILEGLVLNNVVPGLYQLIALPLKLLGAEASPVRAILIRGEG